MYSDFTSPDFLGPIVGLVFIIGIIVMILLLVYFRERGRRLRDKMLHEERLAAIEKGVPVPALPGVPQRPRNYVMRGLVWMAIGLGLLAIAWSETDFPLGIGAIFVFIGLAILIAHLLTTHRRREAYHSETGHHSDLDNPS
jgi:hypothetical protein